MPDEPPSLSGSQLLRSASVGFDRPQLAVWVEHALAKRHHEMAKCLSSLDPRSGAMTFEVADGIVAFFGSGLFVNHAMAVGLERPVETSHLRLLERRAAEVGVDAAIETIDGLASASLTDLLRERGYVSAGETSVLVRSPTEPLAEIDPWIDIAEVRDADVAEWAALSAEGWGHLEPGPRAANDRFADVAHASGTPGLLIARERSSGRGIACADLHVDGEAAILGGASTIPSDRGKGAQSALVVYRLLVAQQMRAAVAITTTEPGSQSERNLVRLGFEHSHTKRMWTRSAMQQPPQIEPEFGGADTC